MYIGKSFLAIIPARGGSKRLPRKNLLDLCGKPLIAWSIEAGIKSKYLDTIVLSSDDSEILKIGEDYKIQTIKRPQKLASDIASSVDVAKHVIKNLESYEYIVLLQPTSPLRDSSHIDEAIELLENKNADAIISVCEMDHSPLWSNTLNENLSMQDFLNKDVLQKRSQDLDKYYRLNGAIYICKTKRFIEESSFFLKKNIYAYVMDVQNSVDIDKRIDLESARLYMTNKFVD